MSPDRDTQTATLLNNGQVLIAGGTTFHNHHVTEAGSAELYMP